MAAANIEPTLALRQVALARDAAAKVWNIRWQVDNLGGDALEIYTVRLPHGQFRSDEQRFAPPLELAGGESKEFQSLVHCQEPAGLVTENAFAIFNCQWRGEAWRILVRLRVTVKANGEPETATELITTQKIGFSRATP